MIYFDIYLPQLLVDAFHNQSDMTLKALEREMVRTDLLDYQEYIFHISTRNQH